MQGTLPNNFLYFSDTNNNAHEFGTGGQQKCLSDTVIGFVPKSKLIYTLRIKSKTHKTSMINVHVPTEYFKTFFEKMVADKIFKGLQRSEKEAKFQSNWSKQNLNRDGYTEY